MRSQKPVTCAAGTAYCAIYPSNTGELPIAVNACKPLTTLPCFATNAGCTCGNLLPEVDASGCPCRMADASLGLTVDCF